MLERHTTIPKIDLSLGVSRNIAHLKDLRGPFWVSWNAEEIFRKFQDWCSPETEHGNE